MAELQNIKGKYPGVFYEDWVQGADGDWQPKTTKPMTDDMMLPDAVLDVLYSVTTPVVSGIFEKHLALDSAGNLVPPLNRHRLLLPEPQISLDHTCAIVIAAFRSFDPVLGDKVADILSDSARLVLEKTEVGEAGGYCMPPGWQGAPKAVIHYRYENTINDAVYIAHELGHLLANDFAQENGHQNEAAWMPKHIGEEPAMFTQCILYDYMIHQSDNPVLQDAARQHMAGEMTRNLYTQQVAYLLPVGKDVSKNDYEETLQRTLGDHWRLFETARQGLSDTGRLHSHCVASTIGAGLYFSGLGKNPEVFDAIFKQGKDSNILKVFEAAGIITEEQLNDFLSAAVKQVSKPVEEIYARHQAAFQLKWKPNSQLIAAL